MTATINVFSMPQVVTLTLGGGTGATLMNYPVNRTDFKLTKGVTTEIMFFVKDVDRHPVTTTQLANANTTAVRIVISDENTGKVLLGSQDVPPQQGDKSVLIPAPGIDTAKGVWMLQLQATDIVDWPLGMLRYSVILDRASDQVMLYTDRGYGPYGGLEVIDGPFPLPPEAITVTPDDMIILGQSRYSGAYAGAANVGNLSGLHNVAFHLTGFMGSVTLQASLENSPSQNDSDWFPANVVGQIMGGTIGVNDMAGTVTFNQPVTGTINIPALGNYMWMRFIVTESIDTPGAFTALDYRGD